MLHLEAHAVHVLVSQIPGPSIGTFWLPATATIAVCPPSPHETGLRSRSPLIPCLDSVTRIPFHHPRLNRHRIREQRRQYLQCCGCLMNWVLNPTNSVYPFLLQLLCLYPKFCVYPPYGIMYVDAWFRLRHVEIFRDRGLFHMLVLLAAINIYTVLCITFPLSMVYYDQRGLLLPFYNICIAPFYLIANPQSFTDGDLYFSPPKKRTKLPPN